MKWTWLLILAVPAAANAAGVCDLMPAGTISALIGETAKGEEVEMGPPGGPSLKGCSWQKGARTVRLNAARSKDVDKMRQQLIEVLDSLAKPIEKKGGKQEKRTIGAATCFVIEKTAALNAPANVECFTTSGDRWVDIGLTMTETIGSARIDKVAKEVGEIAGKL
jgi:hypothetical protein